MKRCKIENQIGLANAWMGKTQTQALKIQVTFNWWRSTLTNCSRPMNSSSTITRRLETLLTTLSTPLQVLKCDSFQAGSCVGKRAWCMGKRCGRSADTVVYFSIHKQQPPPVLGPFLFSQLTQPGIFNSSNFASETNLTDKFAGFMRFNGFLIRRYAAYVFWITKNLKPELAL